MLKPGFIALDKLITLDKLAAIMPQRTGLIQSWIFGSWKTRYLVVLQSSLNLRSTTSGSEYYFWASSWTSESAATCPYDMINEELLSCEVHTSIFLWEYICILNISHNRTLLDHGQISRIYLMTSVWYFNTHGRWRTIFPDSQFGVMGSDCVVCQEFFVSYIASFFSLSGFSATVFRLHTGTWPVQAICPQLYDNLRFDFTYTTLPIVLLLSLDYTLALVLFKPHVINYTISYDSTSLIRTYQSSFQEKDSVEWRVSAAVSR